MTYNFKKKAPRKDTAIHTVFDEDGNKVAWFELRYHLLTDPRWTKRLNDVQKTLTPADQRRAEKPKTAEDIQFSRSLGIAAFLEHVVVDSGIVGEGDEELEHDLDMLKAFFADPENMWVFGEIDAFASEVANFRIEQVEAGKNG